MYEVQRFNDISVIGIAGELSAQNISALDGVLSSLSDCNQHNIVLDFERLEHLDYKVVGRIAERIIEFQCDGGDLKMASASGYIRSIMRAFGLEDEIYVSVGDALMSFMDGASCGESQ